VNQLSDTQPTRLWALRLRQPGIGVAEYRFLSLLNLVSYQADAFLFLVVVPRQLSQPLYMLIHPIHSGTKSRSILEACTEVLHKPK
jgi:hypothetical protein